MRTLREILGDLGFSAPREGGESVPNVPSPEGEALGAELARMTAPGFAKGRERFPDQKPPCSECAFVAGTEPNRCLSTVLDALKCVVEGVPFHCHKGLTGEGDPTKLCAGWVAAIDAGGGPSCTSAS